MSVAVFFLKTRYAATSTVRNLKLNLCLLTKESETCNL